MKALLFLITLSIITPSFAGSDHSHGNGHSHSHAPRETKKETTGVIGRTHIERLVKLEKLDASWKKAIFEKSIMKKNEWVVTFNNEKGVKGKKLYIFLKKSGEFVAANFSGK